MDHIKTSQNELSPEAFQLSMPGYLHSINQAVIITNLDGRINFWNKAATEIYGWNSEEAMERNIIDVVPTQQTKEQAIEIMTLLTQGQSWSGEFIVQRKNGECFPAFVTDLPYYNDQNKLSGVIGISTDLTAQKKSEREIRLLFNNTEESFILVDLQLNIVEFNKQAYDLYKKHLGGSLEKGLSILQFARPGRIRNLKKLYREVLAGNAQQSELVFADKHGNENIYALKYKPALDEAEHIFGAFISVRDITEQKQAEAALIANEAKWHAVVENIHDIFMILDKEGKVKYVSPAITKVLKYEEQELMAANFIDLFHTADLKLINETFTGSLNHPGIQQLTGRARIKHKTGRLIWVEGSIINMLDNKAVEGIIFTSWNVTELVKSEGIVRAEQVNKETLINATDDLIWSMNEKYELVAANTAFVNTLKLSTGIDLKPGDSLLRKDKFTKEWLAVWQSLYSRAFKGESFQQEIYTAKTEHINAASWAEVSFNPILQNNKVTGIACLSRNITERKKQEEKDKEFAVNQSLFSAIINASQDAIISKNMDGIITSWNKGAEEIFGYTASEIIGKPTSTIIPAELIAEEAHILNQIKAKQLVEHFETVRIDKYGNRIIVSLSVSPILDNEGNVVGASKISRDISKQKRDAIALQQNEARLQGIIASQTNYVIRTDLEGRYTYYNNKFFTDFGWIHNMESAIGQSGMESIMPYHHEAVINTVNKCFAEPNKVFQVELDKPTFDGNIKTTFWDFICLTDLQGNPVEIQCVGINISERVHAEKELQRKVEELASSNQELEHFAFVASHDLQEPLRMVTRFLTQLKKNYESVLDDRAKDYIKFAVDGAVRMRQIILDLLEYSRIGRVKQPAETVNSNEVVEEIILLSQKKIEELGARIIFNDLPVIRAHRSPMRQLLQNLVMNALKFTRPGVPPIIEITASDNSEQWLFAVKDNGIGMEKDYFDKIFIIFQRLHNREEYEGSGIGLSIAKKIVENMGGNIWVESTVGQGSTFFFTLKKI
ncbi:hypothetical protein BH11BAC3_BH11BAC3_06760 [soil metagenome]